MFEIRVHDIDRLRVARGQPGQALAWSPTPWFAGVHALAALADGAIAVAGPAGLTRLSADLRRCLGRDDVEPIHDLDHSDRGLLGAGARHLCLWPDGAGPALRFDPTALGLHGPPRRVRWHPDRRRAAVADELGQIVVVVVHGHEVRPASIVGDVPHVDGLVWHPSGRTLVVGGRDDAGGRVWAWTVDDGLVPLAVPADDERDTTCAVAFHPRTGALHVVRGRQRLAQGGWGEPLIPLGEPAMWPTDGRFLEFTAADLLLGSAGTGVQIWDHGVHTWYHPALSERIHLDAPCCCIGGERLLLGSAEGLVVATDLATAVRPNHRGPNNRGREAFAWGVPPVDQVDGAIDLAPDGAALALASGTDRVTVWGLDRAERPVAVRTWDRAGVHHRWDPSGSLEIRCGDERVDVWARLDRGDGDDDDAAPAALADAPADAPPHGWQLAELAPGCLVLRDPAGRLHPQDMPPLQILGAAWARSGDLVIVGASPA